jgi:hypothetical protein
MFYYKVSKNPKLEVSISKDYSETDIQRIFLFIDALIDSPKVTVVFKVNPLLKEDFKEEIVKNNACSFYNYQIQ